MPVMDGMVEFIQNYDAQFLLQKNNTADTLSNSANTAENTSASHLLI